VRYSSEMEYRRSNCCKRAGNCKWLGKAESKISPAGKMISDSGIRKLAELAFAHKASAMDFKVSKPYGDSERYDFVVDSGSGCGGCR